MNQRISWIWPNIHHISLEAAERAEKEKPIWKRLSKRSLFRRIGMNPSLIIRVHPARSTLRGAWRAEPSLFAKPGYGSDRRRLRFLRMCGIMPFLE